MFESTQVSSKYDPENVRLFKLTARLRSLGVRVVFPKTDTVVEYVQEFAITHPQEKTRPFHNTQIDFLRAVRRNPYHIIFNRYEKSSGLIDGYIGESASIEMLFALAHNKPIVCMTPTLQFGARVDPTVAQLLRAKQSLFHYADLEALNDTDLQATLASTAHTKPNYNLSYNERRFVISKVRSLCEAYKHTWHIYQTM